MSLTAFTPYILIVITHSLYYTTKRVTIIKGQRRERNERMRARIISTNEVQHLIVNCRARKIVIFYEALLYVLFGILEI